MRNIMKYCLLSTFLFVTAICSAQTFTVSELVNLVSEKQEDFKNAVSAKGYTQENIIDNGMSKDYEYSSTSMDSKVSMALPSFDSDVKMISWEFRSSSVYNALKNELAKENYKLKNTERRSGGKYLSTYYSRPGIDIILTSDRTEDSQGKYIFSVKYTNAAKYIVK
jgi:hypothetical protein